ncbi:MAG TPA: Wzz/FepE/Etk N-terminal domain-containing protein, partial [Chitinophagaceae bacterium]|nr:Wzz/FepE/Etk N-terminal domain-containing protein [Chitinophagaceae bacterium]
MTRNSQHPKKDEDISLRDLILKIGQWMIFLKRKWRWIVLCAFIGTLAGLTYAFLTKTEYRASISFVTDTKQESSGLSAYAGLASQLGFNLGNLSGSNELFSGDNIFDLMETRLMLKRTLLTPVEIDG